MAFVMPPCACNSSSDNHLACHLTSYISCNSKRHFLSLSEFAGSWALPSLYKHKLPNAIPACKAESARAMETHVPNGNTQMPADAGDSPAPEGVQASIYALALLDMHDYKSDCISEEDLLRLQRARLAKMELSLFNSIGDEADDARNEDNASSSMHLDSSHSCGRIDSNDERCTSRGEIVSVRSTKHKERLAKRKRATVKARATSASVLAASEYQSDHTDRHLKAPLQRLSTDRIRSFLVNNGSGKPKLLTAAEEVNLSHKIQDLLKLDSAKKVLKKQLGREPTLAEWADAMHMKLGAFSRRLTEGQLCKSTMIKCNLRLVISVAKKYEGKGLSIEDLIQEGSQGLIRGCEKFDPKKGCKFSTYAHWWIMQAITKALLQKSRLVRLPSHASDTLLSIRRAKDFLKTKYGHSPSDLDISKYSGISMERMRLFTSTSKYCKSIDKPVGKDMNMNLADIIPDTSMQPSDCKFLRRLLKEDVDSVLRTLKPKEREVMRLRYGLDDGKLRTLEDIGRLYHVTRERIRQIEGKAMSKLREPERMEALRSLLSEC